MRDKETTDECKASSVIRHLDELRAKNTKVGVYVRVSTFDQAKGVQSQELALSQYLAYARYRKPSIGQNCLRGGTDDRELSHGIGKRAVLLPPCRRWVARDAE